MKHIIFTCLQVLFVFSLFSQETPKYVLNDTLIVEKNSDGVYRLKNPIPGINLLSEKSWDNSNNYTLEIDLSRVHWEAWEQEELGKNNIFFFPDHTRKRYFFSPDGTPVEFLFGIRPYKSKISHTQLHKKYQPLSKSDLELSVADTLVLRGLYIGKKLDPYVIDESRPAQQNISKKNYRAVHSGPPYDDQITTGIKTPNDTVYTFHIEAYKGEIVPTDFVLISEGKPISLRYTVEVNWKERELPASPASPATPTSNNCPLFGNIYITSSWTDADVVIYVTDVWSFADLVVHVKSSNSNCYECGDVAFSTTSTGSTKVYISPTISDAHLKVYFQP